MAGLEAARAGAKVAIIEKNSTAARKLLCTGRGRCNITHEGEVDDLVRAYGRCGRFLRHSLYEYSPADVCAFLAENRLDTKVEKEGCVFPLTDRASDVKRILVDQTRRCGIEFIYGRSVKSVEKDYHGFVVQTDKVRAQCKSVVIATGGVSWPETGSTGEGYELARRFGHEIIEPRAALVPLVTQEKWVRRLQGNGVANVKISATVGSERFAATGAMMFTDDGIGGPVVFDFSRLITDKLVEGPMEIKLDFAHEHSFEQMEELLIAKCAEHPKKEIAWILIDIVPRPLGITLCGMLDPEQKIRTNQLSKEMRRNMIRLLKELPLKVKSTRPINEAVVTKGGVATDQIDPKTMESKLCQGLFFAGEVMDVDGPCGGYNLQIAWSTGVLAGRCAGHRK